MFFKIACGIGNLFYDIRGETSACAQDGPSAVPKADTDVRLMHAHYIYPMRRNRTIQVPTRNRLLLLHFQYILAFMNENLGLKSHYVLSLIRMLQEQHVLVSSQK